MKTLQLVAVLPLHGHFGRRIQTNAYSSLPSMRRYLSSDSKAGPAQAKAKDDDDKDAKEEKTTTQNGIVRATVPKEYPQIMAVPVSRRPVFPGFYKTISVKDKNVADALSRALKKGKPYVGLFLSKEGGDGDVSDKAKEGADEDQASKARTSEDDNAASETKLKPSPDTIKSLDEIYAVGVFAQIINVIPMPIEGGVTAIVYPHRRIRAKRVQSHAEEAVSIVENENVPMEPFNKNDKVIRAISQEIFGELADVAKLNSFFREHITHHNVSPSVFEDPSKLADFVAVLSSAEAGELQAVLEEQCVEERLRKALLLVKKELIAAQLQARISKDVEQKLTQRQREYFLHEQLKSIKKELGLETDVKEKLRQTFEERVGKLQMTPAVKKVYEEELSKLSVLEASGAEFNVTRNYLDWLTQLPWGRLSADNVDIAKAQSVLDKDHYGLPDVKDRILEFIAINKLKKGGLGKILCLVGPPGVGKTSIGKSIARALDRKYFRFSVGGLHDVAEIKGHRRTYIGAMPGKVVQALKTVKVENPLILIDEIDKLGRAGHQGDPSSALLELLDPEQNVAFMDHYLDVPLDVGKVLFVCTANQSDTIPAPLLDRMELIRIAGYTLSEKLSIAQKYLLPQVQEQCGLTVSQCKIEDDALESLIKFWCRESGVRNLKKQIEKIYRKAALIIVRRANTSSNDATAADKATCAQAVATDPVAADSPIVITTENLTKFVGNAPWSSERLYCEPILPLGVITGLAWTSNGGSILYIETIVDHKSDPRPPSSAASTPSPSFIKTGQLGDVMKESVQIAYSYAKSFLLKHCPENKFFQTSSLHLHVPEGATPKDGPSAGCTMTTSILSQALGLQLPSDIAMTGELSLTGRILKIGGVKEKVLAARRSAIKHVILPEANKSDWKELDQYLRDGLKVTFVSDYEQIANLLFFSPQNTK